MDMTHWQSCGRRGGMEILKPVLQPYVAVEVTGTKIRFARNPYYFKVDTEGKQLPYVDYLYTVKVNDMETMKLKAAAGEINFQAGDIMKLQDAPSWIKGGKTGNYRVSLNGSINNPAMLFMNQDYDYENPNSVWQKLIQDPKKRFAKALAMSMDHDDVNNSLYFGKYSKPDKCDWCKHNNAEYNVDKANALLDEIGMKARDDQGFRKAADGSPFTLLIYTATDHSPDNAALAILLGKYFQKIGLNARVNSMLGKSFNIKIGNNEHQVAVMWNDGPIWGSGISEDYLPAHKAKWAPRSMKHFDTGGKEGRTPPAYLKKFFNLHSARYATLPESPEGHQAFLDLVKWMSENYVMIYPTSMTRSPNIYGHNLRNVPKEGYPYGHGINEAGEQLWFDN
jgi:peptide/nickel transport system substrate-binding protein